MTAADALAWLMTYALHSTLLLGGVWLLTTRGAVRSHHLRDLFWKVALVGGLVTATAQTALRQVSWGDALATSAARTGLVMDAAALPMPMPMVRRPATGTRVEAPATRTVPLMTLVFLAWGGIAAAALLGLASAHVRLARRLGRRTPVGDTRLRGILEALRAEAGIRRPVRLTQSRGLNSPVALGRSEICVPHAVLTELDAAQQRGVLAHELAHLTRHDPLWLTGAGLLERLFFFQPLNQYARRKIQESAEYLCDDWAVGRTGSGLTMAKSLVKVAEWIHAGPSPVPLAGMAENPSQLMARVKRLVEHRGGAEARRVWPVPLSVALLVLTAAAAPGVTAAYAGEEGAELIGQEYPGDTLRIRPRPEPLPMPRAQVSLNQLAERALDDLKPVSTIDGKRDEEALDTVGVAALIAALRDPDAGVRRAAAHSLGNIENARATEPLVAALRDQDVEVRRSAAWALGNIEDRRAVDGLSAALKDGDAEVRKSAAWALGNIEDPRAADALAGALRDESAEVRKNAAWAIGELDLTVAPQGLIDAMRDSDAEVRKTAVWAVGEMGDARAVPALKAMLGDASAEIREGAINALSEIRDASALQALIDAMQSKDADVRRAAAAALGDR
jgi:beta-lactamase regulating signal transducer with metallopeptidase domain